MIQVPAESVEPTEISSQLQRIQSAIQTWRGGLGIDLHEDSQEHDEGVHQRIEHRTARITKALGLVAERLDVLNSIPSELVGEETDGFKKLTVVRMHKTFANHPFVRQRRPTTNYKAYEITDSVEAFFHATSGWPLLSGFEEEKHLKELVDSGQASYEKLEINDWDSETEHSELEMACAIGTDAYLRFYEGNVRLVFKFLPNYSKIQGADAESLLAAGLMGITKAIAKFDPEKGWKFSTYASWWIRQGMQRELANHRRVIRLPVHVQKTIDGIRLFRTDFFASSKRMPSFNELIDEGFSVEDLEVFYAGVPASLDRKIGEDSDTELYDLVPAEEAVGVADEDENPIVILGRLVKKAYLDPREAIILSLRYNTHVPGAPELPKLAEEYKLSLDETGESLATELTLQDIGKIFDLTRERIRQVEVIALNKLKNAAKTAG